MVSSRPSLLETFRGRSLHHLHAGSSPRPCPLLSKTSARDIHKAPTARTRIRYLCQQFFHIGRAAALLLATEAGGVFVVDEPRVVMTPPLSCVSASPGKRASRSVTGARIDAAKQPVSFSSAPAPKHRRASTQFWTTPRASFSSATCDSDRTTCDTQTSRCQAAVPSLSSRFRRRSAPCRQKCRDHHAGSPPHAVRSAPPPAAIAISRALLSGESAMNRQLGAQAAFRSQGAWTPSNSDPGSSASSANSPSSPFGSMLVSGFFGEAMRTACRGTSSR